MLKFSFPILILFFSNSISAQITNSNSADETGIYYYAIDTLIKSIEGREKFDGITIHIPKRTMSTDITNINHIDVVLINNEKLRRRNFKSELQAIVKPIQLSREFVIVNIGLLEWTRKGRTFYGDGYYTYYFKFNSKLKTYELVDIDQGMKL